jgi:hypothetical protein
MIEDLKINERSSLMTIYWFVINLFKWAIIVIIIVMLRDYAQI